MKDIASNIHALPIVADLPALIQLSLEDDKAENIVTIDLSGKTDIADAMIVASGRSNRHVSAIAQHLINRIKQAGVELLDTEGLDDGNWVILDTGDVIIHIFRPETRDYYDLERMWAVPISASLN